jgi:hypothetical protein
MSEVEGPVVPEAGGARDDVDVTKESGDPVVPGDGPMPTGYEHDSPEYGSLEGEEGENDATSE